MVDGWKGVWMGALSDGRGWLMSGWVSGWLVAVWMGECMVGWFEAG